MKKLLTVGFFFLLSILVVQMFSIALAGGGGRAPITVLQNGVAGGQSASIVATIYKDNDSKISPGEKGFFRVRNARDGQNCLTKNEIADGSGKIYGSCSSPVSGEMEVYIFFPDKVEDASPYKVTFAEKGQSATTPELNYMQKTASAPCKSGLVSYGWDESDGLSCGQFQYDAWTAFCGNGYKQHTKLNQCMNANDLSLHPEWKQLAEAMCNDPRCTTSSAPASSVNTNATPAPSPSAVTKRAVTEVSTEVKTGQIKNTANVLTQYLLTEEEIDEHKMQFHLNLKTKVGQDDGHVYLIPVIGGSEDAITVKTISTNPDPWIDLNDTFGLSFTPADKGYTTLTSEPKLFSKKTKADLYDFLKQQKVSIAPSLTQAVDSVFTNQFTQILVLVTDKNAEVGQWLPPVQIDNIDSGIQDMFYPVVWNSGHLTQLTNLTMEIGVVSIDPYKTVNPKFEQHQYSFENQYVNIDGKKVSSSHLSFVKLENVNVGGDWAVLLRRDYPEKATVEQLIKQRTPEAEAPGMVDSTQEIWYQKPVRTAQSFIKNVWGSISKIFSKK
jgi:hypothetical protein